MPSSSSTIRIRFMGSSPGPERLNVARAATAVPNGQQDGERTSLTGCAGHFHPSMMRANQHIDKRQAQPRALHVVYEPGLDPGELLEDAVLLLRRDSDALVRDRKRDLTIL